MSEYYFLFQNFHKIFPNITLYYKICRKYFPILFSTIMLIYINNTFQYYKKQVLILHCTRKFI